MEYTIEYNPKSNACTIKVTGEFKRPQDSHEIIKKAGDCSIEHKCSRFLIDMREAIIIGGTYDSYQSVFDPEKYGVSRRFRIAVVYTVITLDHRFIENVSVNFGYFAF